MPGKLTTQEVLEFLDSRPGWITFTTIGSDGYPHSIPIGYFRDGPDVLIGGMDKTQKIVNVERNPKVSLSLESGQTMQDIKGVLIQGEGTVVSDPKEVLELNRTAARARGAPEDSLPSEARPGAAYVRVKIIKVISWDYSR